MDFVVCKFPFVGTGNVDEIFLVNGDGGWDGIFVLNVAFLLIG